MHDHTRIRSTSVVFVVFGLALIQAASAASDTWNQAGGSHSWNSGANWLSGVQYPNGSGDVAYFTNNITSGQDVTISPAVTVGGMVIGDADGSHGFLIGASGQTVNLDNGVSALTINALSGFSKIYADLNATGANKDLTFNVASGASLYHGDPAVNPALNINKLTKTGAGTLFLWGSNAGITDPNIAVNAGALLLDTLPLPTNSVVTLGSGASMNVGGGRYQAVAEVRGLGEIGSVGSQLIVGDPTGVTRSGLTIANGGVLRPGDVSGPGGIGTLYLGISSAPTSPEFEIGSKTYFDIASYASFDQIDAQRTVTTINGGDIYINFLGGFVPTNETQFRLIVDTNTQGMKDGNGGNLFDNIYAVTFGYATNLWRAQIGDPVLATEDPGGLDGRNVIFTYIPEPTIAMFAGLGGLLVVWRRAQWSRR